MKKIKNLFGRLPLLLLAGIILCSWLGFSSNPQARAEAFTEPGQEVQAVQLGYAWVTAYDSLGGVEDLVAMQFGHYLGHHSELSGYIGNVIDNENHTYLVNWRPVILGDKLNVCGLRVAYRLPDGQGGFEPDFNYVHIAGSALLPRDSRAVWATDEAGGCIYLSGGHPSIIFNISLNIPSGSRIDYLRVSYYKPITDRLYLPMTMRK